MRDASGMEGLGVDAGNFREVMDAMPPGSEGKASPDERAARVRAATSFVAEVNELTKLKSGPSADPEDTGTYMEYGVFPRSGAS